MGRYSIAQQGETPPDLIQAHNAMTDYQELTTASGTVVKQVNLSPSSEAGRSKALRSLIDICYHDADEAGYEGDREDWEPTELDLDWIVDKVDFAPTEADWKRAGLEWVGSAHCTGDDA